MIRSKNKRRSIAEKTNTAVLESLETRQLLSAVTVTTNAQLQSAIASATAGEEIDIAAGNYNGFQLSASGTAAAPIVIKGETGAIINGTPADLNGYIDLSGCSNVTVEGLTIQASGTAARAGIWGGGYVNDQVTNVTIEDNTVNGTDWWGILFGEMNNSLITDNTVSNVQVQHGIYCGNSCTNITISENTVFDCHGCGIEVNADGTDGGVGISTGIVIENNTLYDNALTVGAEINFDGVQNSIIENNLLYGGQRNGIALYQVNGNGPSSGDTIVNNTIFINSEGPAGYGAISLLDGAVNTTIYNNIMSAAEDSLIVDPASISGLKSDYNIWGASTVDPTGQSYSNNISFSAWQAEGYDTHSIQSSNVAGLFVDSTTGSGANFNLAAGSAAIGAGTSTDAPALDMVGNARPTGNRYDIGALQYQGTAPTSTTTPVTTTPVTTAPVTTTTPTVTTPAAPTDLAVRANTTAGVALIWTENGNSATGFVVERSTDGVTYTSIGTTTAGTDYIVDSNVTPGTTYTYEVMAVNSAGDSAPSATATATAAADPITVTTPIVTTTTPTDPTDPTTPTGGSTKTWTGKGWNHSGHRKVNPVLTTTTTTTPTTTSNNGYTSSSDGKKFWKSHGKSTATATA